MILEQSVRAQLEILGATIEQMPPSDSRKLDQEARVLRVKELLARRPDVHWMRQYHDDIYYLGYEEFRRPRGRRPRPRHPHRRRWRRLRRLHRRADRLPPRHGPAVELVGLQPFGSITFGSEQHADPDAIIAGNLVAQWLATRDPDRTHLVIGAGTGHRYVERVFARHREAPNPATLRPKEITALTDLAMPWSVMRWERRLW